MIEKFDTFTITHQARIGLLLSVVEKISKIFIDHPETFNLVNNLIEDSWQWTQTYSPGCGDIYNKYNPKLMELELQYHKQPVLLKAFHGVLYMHYYELEKMYVTEYFKTGEEPVVGSDVFEVEEDYFYNCLDYCVEVSENPQALESWIEEKIAILKDRYKVVEDEDLFGEPVSRDFFNEK